MNYPQQEINRPWPTRRTSTLSIDKQPAQPTKTHTFYSFSFSQFLSLEISKIYLIYNPNEFVGSQVGLKMVGLTITNCYQPFVSKFHLFFIFTRFLFFSRALSIQLFGHVFSVAASSFVYFAFFCVGKGVCGRVFFYNFMNAPPPRLPLTSSFSATFCQSRKATFAANAYDSKSLDFFGNST